MALATDLLTNDEARDYLSVGVGDSTKTALLDVYVSAVSALIVEAVGPVVYGTITETYDGGGSRVWLESHPVQSVIQVVEYDGTAGGTLTAESNSAKFSSGFTVNTANGELLRRNDNATSSFPTGTGNIRVTYVAGRCATTATVPSRFKVAAGITLQALWRTQEQSTVAFNEFEVPNANFPRFAMPHAVKGLLADEWRTGHGIGV